MKRDVLQQASEYTKAHRRKKRWLKVVTCLAAVVVFCTTYALILPAITMENSECEIPEHTHTQECYAQATSTTRRELVCSLDRLGIHKHTQNCYDGKGQLICGYADFVVHKHDDSCYDEDGNLWCPLPEIATHTHQDSCFYTPKTEVPEAHTHTDDCYTMERGALICEEPESEGHTHGEECYDENGDLICEIEESDGHQHTDACYEWEKVLTCERSTEPVEAEPAEPELICDKEEIILHKHTSDCFDKNNNLVCGKTQVLEHVHDDNCFETVDEEAEAELICGKEEHQHTEECGAVETEDAETAVELTTDIAEDVSATWYDASGTEADSGLVNGEAFRCELEFTIPAETFEESNPSGQYQLSLDAALQTTSVTDGNCTPVLYEDTQVITLQAGEATDRATDDETDDGIDTADAYTDVACTLTLSGTVQAEENQTQATLLGQSVPIAQSDDATSTFTYTDESTGLTVTLKLDSSTTYTSEQYKLVVECPSQSEYENALKSFTTHGQVIEEAAIYKIYLVQKDNNQTHTSLGCSYTLTMSWSNGLFTEVDSSDLLNFTYCKNPGSEPTELSSCEVTKGEDGNVTALTATDSSYPNSAEFIFVRSSAENGLTAGQYKLTYNEVKDAFLTDAYSQYYNSNSPIGTAGSFHIVAFDTANLTAHTNGNVLAKNLYAGSNFGTNNFANELSYIQNYKQVNATSASRPEHILVVGSENTIDFTDNGNAFSINGTKIDKPYNLIQDKDTATAPFINLERVKAEINQISGNLKGYSNANLNYTPISANVQHSKLELTTPSGVGVANYTAAELSEKLGSYVQIDGFKTGSNGTVVINVDCAGVKEINMPQARVVIDGQEMGTNEVTEFSTGKVIWNFIHAEGVTINTQQMTGMIIAPGATVNINQNLNGTVVADIINVKAESHRTDFTGKITEPDEPTEEDEYYVTVQKIETGYAGSALPGAEFDLYKWENNDWVKVNKETLKTSDKGTVMLHNLEASVAYQLVETKAPVGYALKGGAFYFWVRTDSNQTQPNQRPSDFSGSTVEVGGTLLAANDRADGYELPETGGTGTILYTVGGLLLITGAGGLLLYQRIQRRKEESASS